MLDGDRAFDIAFGLITGTSVLALAVPILWWWLPAHRRSLFGERIDPSYRLQLGYGLFCMAMAFTDYLCRLIPHAELPYVHEAFFAITVLLIAGFGPRLVAIALASRRPITA